MSKLSKTGAVLGSLGLLVLGGLGGALLDKDPQPQPVDLTKFVTQADLANVSAQVDGVSDQIATLQADTVWEGTAEGLALIELADRDYRDLGRFILENVDTDQDDLDELDLSVEVRDTDFSNMDADDQEGTVTFDLRVRYDDGDGHRTRTDVWATAIIEDGEVEDLDFSLTDPSE